MFNRLSDEGQCGIVSIVFILALYAIPERIFEIVTAFVIMLIVSNHNAKQRKRLQRYIKHADEQYNEKR